MKVLIIFLLSACVFGPLGFLIAHQTLRQPFPLLEVRRYQLVVSSNSALPEEPNLLRIDTATGDVWSFERNQAVTEMFLILHNPEMDETARNRFMEERVNHPSDWFALKEPHWVKLAEKPATLYLKRLKR